MFLSNGVTERIPLLPLVGHSLVKGHCLALRSQNLVQPP